MYHRTLLTASLSLLLCWTIGAGDASANVVFDDGLEHDFAGSDPGGLIVTDSAAGNPTTVNVRDGASLGSVSEVSGASSVHAFDGSTFGDVLRSSAGAFLTVSGGMFRTLDSLDASRAVIDGGRFSCAGSGRCMGLFDDSTAQINGGSFSSEPVIAFDRSMLQVRGGSFPGGLHADRGTVDVYGGAIASVNATNATMTIYGTGFEVFENGVATPLFTGYGAIPEFTQGVISGTLSSGAVLTNMPYQVGNNGRIVISMVPEPAITVLLGAGLAVILGASRRRRVRM